MEDDRLIPISALQHYAYCPRQCALIHVEQEWQDNVLTYLGIRAHKAVDAPARFLRMGIRVEYNLPVFSDRLGLIGRADAVEFPNGIPYPVEWKLSLRRETRPDEIQLCAQALCLEEMFQVPVPKGAIYYHRLKRRKEVVFTPELRDEVLRAVREVSSLMESGILPPAPNDKRCKQCSLLGVCMPHLASSAKPTFLR